MLGFYTTDKPSNVWQNCFLKLRTYHFIDVALLHMFHATQDNNATAHKFPGYQIHSNFLIRKIFIHAHKQFLDIIFLMCFQHSNVGHHHYNVTLFHP